jgi:hypothetical protein
MRPIGRRFLTGAMALSAVFVRRADAQWTPALWVDLVQMPVAVAQLHVAGVPIAGLSLIVPALNVGTVTPTLFLSSLRGVTILDGWVWDDSGAAGMGAYVQALHARGLRGPALADAIHDELRDRGVPGGPKRANTLGFDVLNPAFFNVPVGRLGDPDPRVGVGRGRAGGRGDGGAASGRGAVGRGSDRGGQSGEARGAGRGRGQPSAPGVGPAGSSGSRGGGPGGAAPSARGRGDPPAGPSRGGRAGPRGGRP